MEEFVTSIWRISDNINPCCTFVAGSSVHRDNSKQRPWTCIEKFSPSKILRLRYTRKPSSTQSSAPRFGEFIVSRLVECLLPGARGPDCLASPLVYTSYSAIIQHRTTIRRSVRRWFLYSSVLFRDSEIYDEQGSEIYGCSEMNWDFLIRSFRGIDGQMVIVFQYIAVLLYS